MRLRSIPPEAPRPRRRRTLRTVQLLPTLMTAGNLMAGVLAIAYMVDAAALQTSDPLAAERLYVRSAWLIFIGMFLDGLDGRVARMTGTTSDFGAQLDSLADCVTFGVAPAMVAKTLLGPAFPAMSTKLVFGICLVYTLGAALRLARYNVESDRMKSTGRPHVTRIFRGLPSPAAGGAVAALVLLRNAYAVHDLVEWTLLLATPVFGLLMVSRMPYSHVLNRYLDARRAHPVAIVLLVLFVYLVFEHFIETVAGIFTLYALSGPLFTLSHLWFGVPAWVEREDDDEEEGEAPDLSDEDEPPAPDEQPVGEAR